MKPKIYGYIRVSTREQNEDRQRIAMREFGVPENCLYLDKQSGKNFDRPAWKKLMRVLRANDTLVVKSIDRLGRSYMDVLETWRTLTAKKGVSIVVLDTSLLDTRTARDLTGTFISDLVLQFSSYFAQLEREFNRQRQAEGIHAAKIRGVKFGRPRKHPPQAFRELHRQWRAERISIRLAAKQLGVAPNTFRKWAQQAERNEL